MAGLAGSVLMSQHGADAQVFAGDGEGGRSVADDGVMFEAAA
jgi:hypothetical protein